MTEKEKAKAYDEAIERAKELYGNGITEEIFPELKEDNDEKIRRWIIDDIRYNMNNEPLNNSEYKKKAEKAIAWLETQGEQKPTLPKQKYKKDNTPLLRDSIILNKYGGVAKSPSGAIVSDALVLDYDELAKLPKEEKIEPKFKVGDWIISSVLGIAHIIGTNDSNEFQLEYIDGKQKFSSIDYVNYAYDKWTINNAKDGDVLFTSSSACSDTFVFKSIDEKGNAECYFAYDSEDGFTEGKYHFIGSASDCKPATKAQCDFLMKAMKDARYEWDSEKKELKKSVEPKFKVGDKITNSFRKYVGASGSQSIISEITDNKYIFTDGSYIFISNQDSWELAPDKNPKFDPETLKTYNDINIGDTVYIWGRGDSSVDETTITEKYDDRGHWNLKFSNGCVGRALKNGTSSTMGMYDCLVYSDKEAVRESINERIKILSNIKI